MKSYVPEDKLAYMHNPVVLPINQAAPDKSRIILNVGRLVPQKAQGLIFEAFARLNCPNWRIHILGDGPEEQSLLSKAESLGIESNISLKGFVKDTERHYLEAGIFVLASEYEGMSNALLEAMAFGLPCIVSDALPGALEHIRDGETGLVFEGGNVQNLAEKLHMLMSSATLRVRLGDAARVRMREYSPEKVTQAWDEVLFPLRCKPQ
jgi:glycosyltransferase involved in cell wall biosynthesis